MPSYARADIMPLDEIGMFHCWNRCVRRAFLCGTDALTGKNYDYRQEWIRATEESLAGLFAVEVAFRSEMENHLHLVLRIRPDIVGTWSDEDVVRRWLKAAKWAKSLDGTVGEPDAVRIAQEMAKPGRCEALRKRLINPSWFMGILCESISRRSNREDQTSGHFWEDRFGCRQLLDEPSIVACGIYVDLNPIRAGIASTPEESTHTSAYDRIQARQARLENVATADTATATATVAAQPTPDGWMCELTLDERASINDPSMTCSATERRASDKGLLSISLDDYLRLLDASGRIVKAGKSGSIPEDLPPILERLGICAAAWTDIITDFDRMFGRIAGSAERVAERVAQIGRRWCRGMRNCAAAFSDTACQSAS